MKDNGTLIFVLLVIGAVLLYGLLIFAVIASYDVGYKKSEQDYQIKNIKAKALILDIVVDKMSNNNLSTVREFLVEALDKVIYADGCIKVGALNDKY